MLTLLLSLAAIGVAPLLDRPLSRSGALASGADAFAAVAVLGTVLLHVLPHGVESLGWLALLAAAAGLALPSICDLGGIRILGLAAVAGLGAHALVDGAMLAAPEDNDAGHALSWAVVIHTVPLSLAVWRAARPHGATLALLLLGYTALAELLGWVGARELLDASGAMLSLLQCFTAGTLLHFVWAPRPTSRRGSGVGALLGGLAIVAMNQAWPLHRLELDELTVEATLLGLVLTMAPALLAGVLGLAALHGLAAKRHGSPATAAGSLGKGLTLGLLATLAPLGAPFLVVRGLSGLLMQLIGRISVSGLRREASPGEASSPGAPARADMLSSLRALVDAQVGQLLLGLGLAGVLEALLPAAALAGLSPWLTVPLAAVLAPLFGLGAVGITPVAAVLLHKGLGVDATLAAVLTASTLSVRDSSSLSALRGRRVALRHGAALLLASLGLAALSRTWSLPVPALHDVVEASGTTTQWVALALLGALGVEAVLRGGLPVLMGPLSRPHVHTPDHDHGHEHGHGHGHG